MQFYENVHYCNLFPSLVVVYEDMFVQEVVMIEQTIRQIVEAGEVEYCNLDRGGPSVTYHSQSDLFHRLPDEVKVPFLYKLEQCIEDFSCKIGESELVVSNSWFNIQYECSPLLEHTHPGSIISGALYVNVDDNSSPLRFKNINPYAHFSHRAHDTEYNCTYEEFETKTGTLVLFPSWLPHSTLPNKSKERVVVSFNTSYKK